MRIIQLQAENFKRIKAVEITPDGDMVEVRGDNGAGKSSILDAIESVLRGKSHSPSVPLRTGTERGIVRLDLGANGTTELIVTMKMTRGGQTLTVESADKKASFKSPQAMLDAMIGALSFDPLAFTNMKPRDQFEALRKTVTIDYDFAAATLANQRDFEDRTDVNRQAKQKRAAAEAIVVAPDLPAAPVDESALTDRLQSVARDNAALDVERADRVHRRQGIERQRRDVDQSRAAENDLATEIAQLRFRITELEGKAEAQRTTTQILAERLESSIKAMDELPPIADPVDASAVRAELERARVTNRAISERERRAAILVEADGLEKKSAALTKSIDERNAARDAAIAATAMPVPGLGFGDGIVLLDGVPFEQAASSQQLRVSVAIAMAANPKLRIIRIKDGGLLGPTALKQIGEMAREGDYQIWIETVDVSGQIGFVIEDGLVVSTPKSRAAKGR